MKNMQPTSRGLRIIEEGPLAGMIYSDNPFGIPDDEGGGPDIIIPGEWWVPYLSSSVLDPAPNGFTQITLPAGAKMIYLSDSGSDSSNGLTSTTPKRTAQAAADMISPGAGDILCIERGSSTTWDFYPYQVRNNLRGGAAGKPTIVTWYGTGSRPRVIPPIMDRTYHSWFWWVGIHFVNPYAEFGNPDFNGGMTKRNLAMQSGGISHVLVEDCRFTGVELLAQVQGGLPMSDFTIRRNIWDYVYFGSSSTTNSTRPSCIFSQHVDGLTIEENVHDYCGWHPDVVAGTYNDVIATGSGANMYNHCYYIGEGSPYDGPLIQNNLISRPSSHGWQLRSGGIAYRNTTIYAVIGGAMGYTDVNNLAKGVIPAGRLLRMQENLVLRNNGMYRMIGSCATGMCTPARWGIDYTTKNVAFDESQAIWESIGNVVAETSTDINSWPETPSQNNVREIWRHNGVYSSSAPHEWVQRSGNRFWHYTNSTEGDGQFEDPGRSIEGFFESISQESMTFDQCMDVMKSRGAYEWNSSLTPVSIHNYIMSGYEPA